MSASANTPSGRTTLPPLDLRGSAPFGQTVVLAARSAFAALAVHKLRAVLTILGIVVGIAGLFVLGNLMVLTRSASVRGIGRLGANVIDVAGFSVASTAPPATGGGPVIFQATGAPSLTIADVQTLQKLPHVVGVTPRVGNRLQVQAGDHNWTTQVFGAYPAIQITQGYSVEQGTFFSQIDVTENKTVAVLGQTVAKQLFPNGNAVGKQIRIGSVDFTVAGVLKPLGNSGQGGKGDLDDVVVVPASTFLQRLMGSGPVRMISGGPPSGAKGDLPVDAEVIQAHGVQNSNPALARSTFPEVQVAVDDPDNVQQVKIEITRALEQNHGIQPGGPDDFTVGGFLQGVVAAQQSAAAITWGMGAITVVALLIGGFGVANVMLATVAERRREIGVRLAIGARTEDIFWQFLLEALALAVIGGMLGTLGGMALSQVLSSLSPQFAGLSAAPSGLTAVAAIVVTLVLGISFGAYPAQRAAQISPVEVLRQA
ncbi:MAG: ABC transporter permease [Chloroflexi bacterium]|nr:ABC transporter permease [Chloroflexota bacterium]